MRSWPWGRCDVASTWTWCPHENGTELASPHPPSPPLPARCPMNAMDHLLARSTGSLQTVQPRLPGRFESVANGLAPEVVDSASTDDAQSWGELDQERTVRPAISKSPSKKSTSPRTDHQEPPSTVRARIQASLPVVHPETPLPPPNRDVPRQSVDPSQSTHPPAPTLARITEPPSAPSPSPTAEPRSTDTPRLEPHERPTLGPNSTAMPERDRISQSTDRPNMWTSPLPSLAVPRGLVAPTPEALPAAEPPRPRIDVRIGHIEVRQAPRPDAQLAPPPPRARRPRATVSLEDYLRRRGS